MIKEMGAPTDAHLGADMADSTKLNITPLLFGAALTVMVLLVAELLYAGYRSNEEQALTISDDLATVIASNLSNALMRARRDVNSFNHFLRPEDFTSKVRPERREEIESLLADHLIGLTLVTNYRVFDAAGNLIYGGAEFNGRLNYADRQWFQTLRDKPQLSDVVSNLLIGRISHKPTLILAVPFRDVKGQFLGAVDAVLDMDSFQSVIDAPDLGPNGVISVRRNDTAMLVLHRPKRDDMIGQTYLTEISRRITAGEVSGTGDLRFSSDGIMRAYAFHQVESFPFAVTVSLARQDYMSTWMIQAGILGGLTLLSSGFMATLFMRQNRSNKMMREFARIVADGEREYHDMFQSLPVGVIVRGADGTVERVNDAACVILGQTYQTLLSTPSFSSLLNAVNEDGSPLADEDFPGMKALLTDKPLRGFLIGFGLGPDKAWISVNSQPLFRKNETKPYAVISSFGDVTLQKRMDKMLRDSEERYRMTFEQAALGIVHTDFNGIFLRFNERFAEIIGYPMDEVKGLSYQKITPAYEMSYSLDAVKPLLSGACRTVSWEKRYMRKDGALTWVKLTSSIQNDGDGKPLHYITLVEDINDLKAAQAEIAAQQVRLELLLSSAGEGIVGIDSSERIMFMNKAARTVLGWGESESEVVGVNLHNMTHNYHKDGTAYPQEECPVHQTLVDGVSRTVTTEVFWRQDGTWFPVEYTVAAIREKDAILGCVVVFHDITERVRMTQQLQELADTDPLTGVANRRAFTTAVDGEFQRIKRFNSSAALLMIDIDHFKQVNDRYGHDAGDSALVALARVLSNSVRATDLVARFGCEEFVLLLIETDLTGAVEMAERIREAVGKILVAENHQEFGFTVSVGVSMLAQEDDAWTDALTRADEAMYQAKGLGRNRVEVLASRHNSLLDTQEL